MAKAAARPLTPTWPLLAGVVWDVFTCKGVQSIAENHQAVLTYAYAPRKLDLAKPNESLSMMRFHNGGVGDEDRVDKVMQVLNQSQRAVSKNSARSLLFATPGLTRGNAVAIKREMALTDFLRRAMRMAIFVSVGLLAYIALTISYMLFDSRLDSSTTVRTVALLLALRIVVFTFILRASFSTFSDYVLTWHRQHPALSQQALRERRGCAGEL